MSERVWKRAISVVPVLPSAGYHFGTRRGERIQYDSESEEEHIQECLTVTEGLEDKDYYFLTLECIKRLYQKGKYEKFVKEEILMQSALYKESYETGRKDEKTKLIIKFLTKRFGVLPADLKKKIEAADAEKLDVIAEELLDYKNIDEVQTTLD